MLRILFQEPFVDRKITYGRFKEGAGNNTFPYGIASIAAYVRGKNYEVKYLEPNIEKMTLEEYKKYLIENNFDLVCMGSTTLQIGRTLKNFEIVKKTIPNTITVLGGIHASIMPKETLEDSPLIDYLVLGEGEKPFKMLLEYLRTKRMKYIEKISGIAFRKGNNITINPPDYDNMLPIYDIPFPAYDIFPMRKYVSQVTYAKTFPSYSILASRGCPFKCAFCNASDIFGRKVRYKEIDKVIDEILFLKQRYGAKGIMFLDSTFTINKSWVRNFCKRYIERRINLPWACNSRVDTIDEKLLRLMKKAGCWEIMYGIESANQKSLDILDKRTTVESNTKALRMSMKIGFYTYASYIICIPGETENDVLNTIKYAKKIGTPISMFYLPIPFPKTKLWNICKEQGVLREDANWEDFNSWEWRNPVYINPLIGKEKMKMLLEYGYSTYYKTPKVIYRNLKEILLLRQSIKKYILAMRAISGVSE